LLALLEEEAAECKECGHPRDVSHDRKTQGTWQVHTSTCEACRVLEAQAGSDAKSEMPQRGMKYAVIRAT
jgi:hypothetical protein